MVKAPTTFTERMTAEERKEQQDALNDRLHLSASRGDVEGVQKLLAVGVDVNSRDTSGCTAFMKAAENGYMGVVRELLPMDNISDNQASNRYTALTLAAQNGHIVTRENILQAHK